jgi:hypothetical protein
MRTNLSAALVFGWLAAGCCFAINTPEPCHDHVASTGRFAVTGTCGASGVLELSSTAGTNCDLAAPSGAALGLPTEGTMYGPGTSPLSAGRWFLGWAPRDPMPNDAVYRQCQTTVSGTSIDLVCEDRQEGATLREVCRAHLEPLP